MASNNNNIPQALKPKITQQRTSNSHYQNNKDEHNQQLRQHIYNNSHRFVRKVPPRAPASNRQNIYINTKTNFNTQLKRCEELLKGTDIKEIYIHCLGFAITTGLNLTLQLIKRNSETLDYAINTSTIHLIDEYHPLCDVNDISIESRNNSATHIKIFKKNTLNIPGPKRTERTIYNSNKPRKFIKQEMQTRY